MSLSENASQVSDDNNKNASSSNELNDITLIKISNGKIVEYLVGTEEIESYLE